MANKKGMEMSINTVVVIVLAVALLVVAIGFITGFIPKLLDGFDNFPALTVQPTADTPIVYGSSQFVKARSNQMTIGFYNNEAGDVPDTVVPSVSCADIEDVTVVAAGQPVSVGKTAEYQILVNLPGEIESGPHPCTITISQTRAQFIMNVK